MAISVTGIACRYPGANNLRELWENILCRRQQFRRFPDARLPLSDYHDADPSVADKTYGMRAALIDGFEFDWAGHRIPRTTFATADLSHWLALDVALAALEDAGYSRDSVPRERTAVVVGNTLTGEEMRALNMDSCRISAATTKGSSSFSADSASSMARYGHG